MASKKDLVEAHAFSRRRLVTAFVSGAPGGREVEPARPGRTLVGGLALSVLLLAGAAIAGIFSGRTAVDWDAQGLIVSKDTGQLYVIPEDGADLYPVPNSTSARLILGSADVRPTPVEEDEIRKQRPGSPRGIVEAPAVLPPADELVGTGWTACTDTDAGIRLSIDSTTRVDVVDGAAFVVRVGRDDYHLIVQADPTAAGPSSAYVLGLPGGSPAAEAQRDDFLSRLDLPTGSDAVRVSRQFLTLFPAGGDVSLASFGVSGAGRAYAETDGDRSWLVSGGSTSELDPFSLAAFESLSGTEARRADTPSAGFSPAPFDDAHWPTEPPVAGLGGPCGVLRSEPGRAPIAVLGQSPTGDASPVEVAAGEREATVEAGLGALVLSGAWGGADGGEPFLVDTNAVRYPLVGAGAAASLGYADVDAPVVPDTWVELLTPGTELSHDRAVCPPSFRPGTSSCT